MRTTRVLRKHGLEFSRAFPDTLNVLVLDGAPAHVARALVIPENVLLVRLPPYSPELNPVERVWLDLRMRLGDTLPASLSALAEAAGGIRVASPDGRVDAVLVRVNSGATTSVGWNLFLVSAGEKAPRKDALFIAEHVGESDLSIEWTAPRVLEIRLPDSRILHFRNFWSSPRWTR